MSRDGRSWSTLKLDGKESGWQIKAVANGDRAHAVFYYFRNSYNKGLRVATLQAGKQVGKTFTLVREREFNTGWHPNLAIATDGSLWLSYLRHVENKERVWIKLGSPKKMNDHQIADGTNWEDEYKNYYLQTGVGAWLTWWNIANGVPDAEDIGGLELGKTSYDVGRVIMATANLEARYGTTTMSSWTAISPSA